MSHGSERRWKMVESVTVASQSGATRWVLPILENVSPYIKSLEIFDEEDIRPDPTSLDSQLIACHRELLTCGLGLSFGSLVVARLHSATLYHLQFIPFLFDAAPNLLVLSFQHDARSITAAVPPPWSPGYPRFLTRDT
jgi:hypothetical protein